MAPRRASDNFGHLELPQLTSGTAKLTGGGKKSNQTKANKENFETHSAFLFGKAQHLREQWRERRTSRPASAPTLPSEVPLLVKIDPAFDIDSLRTSFDFEVVSEQDDGFIIVAAQDFDFAKLFSTIGKFAASAHGGGASASVHDLSDEEDQDGRLRRILSDDLYAHWSEIDYTARYIVDVSVECLGKVGVPDPVVRKQDESDEKFNIRNQRYQTKISSAYKQWDALRIERETQFQNFVAGYNGTIFSLIDGASVQELPDSFSARIEITGAGLRDLIVNFPFIFEVSYPDTFPEPPAPLLGPDGAISSSFVAPGEDAPRVCIVDSGIQEKHPILEPSLLHALSKSYVDRNAPNDTADQVQPNGHGTRVAGAVLFPKSIPRQGEHQLSCWLINQRVLDSKNFIPNRVYPPALLSKIIGEVKEQSSQTKIFCHSINSFGPCPIRHMSAWAATIDLLSFNHDLIILQSAGNIPRDSDHPIRRGILQHLANAATYPSFLLQASSRVANPAQSFNAVTVGSISPQSWTDGSLSSFGQNEMSPSAFSRSGLGLWGSVKPDLVEFGGDFVANTTGDIVTTVSDVCPELLRAAVTSPAGPLFSSNEVGTSFAAPKVAAIAVELQRRFPDQSALLYRALIALSARWPTWAMEQLQLNGVDALRLIGYGLPDAERATTNNPYRVTLHAVGDRKLKAREVQVFQVPIPQEIRSQANEQDILVEVCLSFAARPRRTRRTIRGYLGVWADWKASNCNESEQSFARRVCKEAATGTADGDDGLPWVLGLRTDSGSIDGARRNRGTLQKDWAVVKAHQLPESFCIAVIGHRGWDIDPNAFCRYALAVGFEAINRDLKIYEHVKVAVDNLQVPVEVSVA
jgi:hypothetical protein